MNSVISHAADKGAALHRPMLLLASSLIIWKVPHAHHDVQVHPMNMADRSGYRCVTTRRIIKITLVCCGMVILLYTCGGVAYGQDDYGSRRVENVLIWNQGFGIFDGDELGGLVVGGVYKGRWIKADKVKRHIAPGMAFRLFDHQNLIGEYTVSDTSLAEMCDIPAVMFRVPDTLHYEYALAASWIPVPTLVDTLTHVPPEAWKLLQQVLRQKGLKNPLPGMVKILAVDVDNDGVLDRVVTTNRNGPPKGSIEFEAVSRGDHSIVFVTNASYDLAATRIINGEVYDGSHEELAAMCFCERSVLCLLDADGDGSMEIAVQTKCYESWDMGSLWFDFFLYKIHASGVTLLHTMFFGGAD